MVISWLTVLESHRKAIRHNLDKSAGWRMTPIGDNQLAHLVKKTRIQCSICPIQSASCSCRREIETLLYIFSNLRHLQKHPPSITAVINKQSNSTWQCEPSPETETSSVYKSEMQIALSRDTVINEQIQGGKISVLVH